MASRAREVPGVRSGASACLGASVAVGVGAGATRPGAPASCLTRRLRTTSDLRQHRLELTWIDAVGVHQRRDDGSDKMSLSVGSRWRQIMGSPIRVGGHQNEGAICNPFYSAAIRMGSHPIEMLHVFGIVDERIDRLIAAHAEPQRIQRRHDEQRQDGSDEQAAHDGDRHGTPEDAARRAGSCRGSRRAR